MNQIKKNIPLLNPSAQELWNRSLEPADRVLITGASGWFGQTAAFMMAESKLPTLLLASSTRTIRSHEKALLVNAFDAEVIEDFQPTLVLDCAFITREKIDEFGLQPYIEANEELQRQLFTIISMPSVNRYVSFSSGAAVYPEDALGLTIENNPYGFLKRKAEIELEKFSNVQNIRGVIARAWSVSGGLVTKPQSFALSDFITQASRGELHIRASTPVFRRYSAIEDLFALALAKTQMSLFSIVNSEGSLVEMSELARAVKREINAAAQITRVRPTFGEEDNYFATSHEWDSLQQQLFFSARGLPDQIRATFLGMKMGGYL